jgi:hypothetical protein
VQEAMLLMEINLQTLRVVNQDDLSVEDCDNLMMDRVDEALESRLQALREIEKEKLQVAKAYNKKVQEISFQIEDLVWKMILPIGSRDGKFGKWSPSWSGPYRVAGIVSGNSYFVETLEGKGMAKAINENYLKHYYPSV